MKEKRSRYIPKTEKELAEKSSNLKCAWCGIDLIERHHIQPFYLGGSNTADNLILLCPNCHALAHKGIITQEQLKGRKLELSGEVKRSSGHLALNSVLRINLGGNTFINTPNIIMSNGENLLVVNNKNGSLVITLRMYDKNRKLLCWMHENKWWVEDEEIFDFSHSKSRFSMLSKEKDLYIDIIIGVDDIDISGRMYLQGYILEFDRNELRYLNPEYEPNLVCTGCIMENCGCAFYFETNNS